MDLHKFEAWKKAAIAGDIGRLDLEHMFLGLFLPLKGGVLNAVPRKT